MMIKKRAVIIFFLVLAVFSAFGEENDVQDAIFERILISHGVNLTLGDSFDDLGLGVTLFRSLVFLDGKDLNGAYLIFALTYPTIRFTHADNVKISDVHLGGIGYRGETPIQNLGFSSSLSVTMGERRIGNTVYGDYYFGLAPEVGLYFPYNSPIDVELVFAPVFNVLNLGGREIKNMTYYEFHLLLNTKNFFKKNRQRWGKRGQ